MRARGLSRAESMKLLVDVTRKSVREAKESIQSSATWADLREETEQFHDELEAATRPNERDRNDD